MVSHLLLQRNNLLQDRFLGHLRDAELHNLLGWDLDGFTSGWVATHACLTIELHKLTEAWENELAVLLNLSVSDFDELLHERDDILFLDIGLGGQLFHELRLGHFHRRYVQKYKENK